MIQNRKRNAFFHHSVAVQLSKEEKSVIGELETNVYSKLIINIGTRRENLSRRKAEGLLLYTCISYCHR